MLASLPSRPGDLHVRGLRSRMNAMKKSIELLLGFAAIVMIALYAYGGGDETKSLTVHWEYKLVDEATLREVTTVGIDPMGLFVGQDAVDAVVSGKDPSVLRQKAVKQMEANLLKYLNKAGKEGWELVKLDNGAIFKRRIGQK